jgi:hypothetical protein
LCLDVLEGGEEETKRITAVYRTSPLCTVLTNLSLEIGVEDKDLISILTC